MTLFRLGSTISSAPPSGENQITNFYWDSATSKMTGQYMGENMTIESFQLDPNAQAYTNDQFATNVNAAPTVKIDNIAADAVGDTELTSTAAKDNLDALADTARGYVKTDPQVGEFPVVAIQRDATGKLDIDNDDVAIV